eukprot:3941070-Rhodomonas_salina.1
MGYAGTAMQLWAHTVPVASSASSGPCSPDPLICQPGMCSLYVSLVCVPYISALASYASAARAIAPLNSSTASINSSTASKNSSTASINSSTASINSSTASINSSAQAGRDLGGGGELGVHAPRCKQTLPQYRTPVVPYPSSVPHTA